MDTCRTFYVLCVACTLTPIKALKHLIAKLVFRQIAALATCLSHVTLSTNSLSFIEPQLGFHIIKVTHGNGVSCFDFCVHVIYSALFLQNVCVCVLQMYLSVFSPL